MTDIRDDSVAVIKREKNFWHNARKYLREYSNVTGIQGLRYVTEKRSRGEKAFWAVILLISLAGCCYMIYEVVDKFQSSPVVVTFATKNTPIYEIPFPAVTICPEAKCAKDMFDYSAVYLNYTQLNQTLTDKQLQVFEYMSVVCDIRKYEEFLQHGNETVEEDFFSVIDLLKPDLRLICHFMGDQISCEDILTPVFTDQGICYSFNIMNRKELFKNHVVHYENFQEVRHKFQYNSELGYAKGADVDTYPKRGLMSGSENSLEILIFSERKDNDYVCNTFYQGYRVMIHNPLDVPRFSRKYFRVPFDKVLVAAIHPELVTTSDAVRAFKPDKRNCYFENEKILTHFKRYTQSNCLLECFTKNVLSKCGCVRFYMPRDNNTAVCGIGRENCLSEAENEHKLEELRSKITGSRTENSTFCDCQPLCTDLIYDADISQSEFFWKEYLTVNMNINSTFAKKHFDSITSSVVSVYFQTDQFITLERDELYGVSDLISNFGGILGLFTGFSLITMAEIIYFVTLRIFYNNRLYGLWSGPL